MFVRSPLLDQTIFNKSAIVSMASSSSSSRRAATASLEDVGRKTKKTKATTSLLGISGCTKNALCEVLSSLRENGYLTVDFDMPASAKGIQHHLATAMEHHCETKTPYGTPMQIMRLSATVDWNYVNPFAQLFYLSSISPSLAKALDRALAQSDCLEIVMYSDEFCPGNPLRPDKGRTLLAVYWTFLNFEAHVLQRAEGWFSLGVLRSSIVSQLPGRTSGLMRRIVKMFFGEQGTSFANGVAYCSNGQRVILRAAFAGFLSDEKAHKEVFGVKGASGTKPCITCKNVVRLIDLSLVPGNYLVGIDCVDYRRFDYHSNADYFTMVDRLRASKPVMTKKAFDQLQQVMGLNYDEDNLLFDDSLRSIVKPVDHCLRDWMHVMVSGGVAGTELSLILQELQVHGISLAQVADFASHFQLQRSRGKVQASWWSEARVADDHMRNASASENLPMIALLSCFMADVVKPKGLMLDHIECLELLRSILDRFSLGSSGAMPFVAELRELITRHGVLFVKLYADHVKPKFHNLFHVPENMATVGKLMSCFVTERKHRFSKQAALYAFKTPELSVSQDVFNRISESCRNSPCFDAAYLVGGQRTRVGDKTFSMSTKAVLPCGEFNKHDVIFLRRERTLIVGRVAFFASSTDAGICAKIDVFTPVDHRTFDSERISHAFFDALDIMPALAWAPLRGSLMRVVLPACISNMTLAVT